MKAASILDTIGDTPHIRINRLFADRPQVEVWMKAERANPGGSIKDRIGLSMIDDAERRGVLGPGSTIVEPTSGNTGIGLAMVAAVRGYRLILVMPESMTMERRRLMAAYGAQLEAGKTEQEGKEYLRELIDHVPVQDKSAREALQTFVGGKGDVLLAYENEAITAQQKGEKVDYVIPDGTILIQNPIAVVTGASDKATKFVEFARGEEAQRIFGEKGYRSVREDLVDETKYPQPKNLFTIDDLGGWPAVNKEFFDPEDSVMASINQDEGFPTEK